MEFIKTYVKERRGTALTLLLFALIFAVTFLLYHLPLRAVLYPTLLCAAAGAVIVVFDILSKLRRYRELLELSRQGHGSLYRLPSPGSPAEAACQSFIRSLAADSAAKEQEAAERYRDTVEYFTVWAHQVKTPLTSMRLALEPEDTALARRLRAGLFQIEQYVGMVLTYLRLDSESTDYVFREQPLSEIVDASLARFAPEFIDRKLWLDYDPPDFNIVTDEKWLSFVLEQLLSNALKYTRAGGVKITAKAPGSLTIEDTGIGIAASDLPRVFEKGYTGLTGRRDERSSGVGLYLVKRVCDNLGVGIALTSEAGAGTRVTLDLTQYAGRHE